MPTSPTQLADVIHTLDADTLRHLAHLAEQRTPKPGSPWAHLTTEALEQGLTMLAAGTPPALGWWQQHQPARTRWHAPTAPKPYDARRWQPWELVTAAIDLHNDRVKPDDAHDILLSLARRHQLTTSHLADALTAYHDPGR